MVGQRSALTCDFNHVVSVLRPPAVSRLDLDIPHGVIVHLLLVLAVFLLLVLAVFVDIPRPLFQLD